MKLLANPIFLRMALVLVASLFAFAMGWLMVRRMRHSLDDEANLNDALPTPSSFPAQTYSAVIQQLKQQKHELQRMQMADRKRAKTSENISAVLLANLSCGVMFFSTQGLVRQANHAARQMLGFASPLGMNARDIFRQAAPRERGSNRTIAEFLEHSLREGTSLRQTVVDYQTPAGEDRCLEMTLTMVRGGDGETLGYACLLTDRTDLARIQQQQQLRGELSAEMALDLRNSLATISGYAQQLAVNRDPELARQLAADIAAEAAHLDRTIGGFLVEARAAGATTKF